MKKIRYTGYLIIGSTQSINAIFKERGTAWLEALHFPDGTGVVALIISVLALAFGTKWLYDKWIWRLIFPEKDLNGTWTYTNSYLQAYSGAAPAVQNTGTVTIKQTPDAISFMNGNTQGTGAHWSSLAVDFDEDGRRLNMIYQVTRINGGYNATKISMEQLTIASTGNVGFFKLRKPTRMTSRFRNVMVTPSELIDIRHVYGAHWEPEIGDCTYVRA